MAAMEQFAALIHSTEKIFGQQSDSFRWQFGVGASVDPVEGPIWLSRKQTSPTKSLGFTTAKRGACDSPSILQIWNTIRFVTCDHQAPRNRYVYAIADADTSYSFGSQSKRDQGFLLLKINRIAGRLLWWKKCHQGANPGNPLRPADPIPSGSQWRSSQPT